MHGIHDSGKDNNKRNLYDKKNPKQPHPTNSHFQSSVITHLLALFIWNVILQMYQIFTICTCFPGYVRFTHPKSVLLMGYELLNYLLFLFSFDDENPGVMM